MAKENKHRIYVSKHWIEHYLNKVREEILDNPNLSGVDESKIFNELDKFQYNMKFVYEDIEKIELGWKHLST